MDTATDLGLPSLGDPPRARTPEAFIEYLVARRRLDGESARAALALAEEMQLERYSAGAQGREPRDCAALLRAARRDLLTGARWRKRVSALILPRSVLLRMKDGFARRVVSAGAQFTARG